MTSHKISDASIISKFKLLVESDLSEIIDVLKSSLLDQNQRDFLKSLEDVKTCMKDLLPDVKGGSSNIPTTEAEFQNHRYSYKNFEEAITGNDLTELVRSTEQNQYRVLKDSLMSNGMPSALEDKLQEIINIYVKVLHQLDRDKMTSQFTPIVL
jgi:hypothetical protein